MQKAEISRIEYGYMETGGPRNIFRQKLIIRFVQKVIERGEILDAGCGNGDLAIKFGEMGYNVYGIDDSEKSVALAQKKIESRSLNDIVVIQKGSLPKIDYPNGTFDAVISGEVLEHIEKDVRAVREFNRVLKKGGFCVITVPTIYKLWDIYDEIAGHLRLYNENDLINLIESNGFKIDKIKFWGFPVMRFYHKYIFLRWANRVKLKSNEDKKNYFITKIGINKVLSNLGAFLFSIDNIFSFPKFSIGMIVRARKVIDV